ncbi:unnamed protein product [Rotaria sp. Silwood1]|nr:unnamed protein product [Rotaria sp. Silwood1]
MLIKRAVMAECRVRERELSYPSLSLYHSPSSSSRFRKTHYLDDSDEEIIQDEVLEVTTLTNSDNKETAEKLAAEAEDIRKEKKEMDNVIADITAQYETARKNLEKTRQDYHNAMKNVPGDGWDSHAWNVYASQRPAETCKRNWYGRRRCRSLRDQQFADYSAEAQQKAQQALNILKEAEKNSKNIYNQQMNKQNELESVINNLTTINLHELSINETIKILLDATKNIALLQGQWSRLSRFFSTLTINTEHTQKKELKLSEKADLKDM